MQNLANTSNTSLNNSAVSGITLEAVRQEVVQELMQQLESGSLDAIHAFGRDIGKQTAEFTDTLLEQVRSKDLDVIGGHLSAVVVTAKSLNMGSLSDKRSRIPLIGGMIDKVKLKGASITVKFQDVRTQIDSLLDEVQSMQGGLAKRVEMLGQAFESVKHEHALLGAHIEAGETARQNLTGKLAQLSASQQNGQDDQLGAQDVQDLKDACAALEKRVADMRVLQHSALQQLPMIRMVQANNRMLIEKFYTIKELTVPAWKRQFTLALSLNEQKNAVQLANAIDDATNEFLRENAKLLKDNTIATAKANQRMVIDVATLQEVHDSLMSTVQEVVQINLDGIAQRNAACSQLQGMREEITRQLGQQEKPVGHIQHQPGTR
ncbi:toxic anion resistance protein [Undibacterium sp. Ji83W]|uniref:toxic anion resistance protein n=1 Tax=Undibacterium sp. Ji83W TaxID=3413043 RepID=UPI003BF08912